MHKPEPPAARGPGADSGGARTRMVTVALHWQVSSLVDLLALAGAESESPCQWARDCQSRTHGAGPPGGARAVCQVQVGMRAGPGREATDAAASAPASDSELF
jgi:hypothetical protein